MSDVDRLLQAFDSGELLRPSPEEPNLVDLSRAIAVAAGAEGVEPSPGMAAVMSLIGTPEHLVFVLADGLGMSQLETLSESAFLRRHLAMEMLAVFPSTTAVGLTTLATGEWPAQHAITGWWTYLPELDEAVTVVRCERRSDERPLEELGIALETLLPLPSLMSRMQRDVASYFPQRIHDSTYSSFATGGTTRHGYRALGGAIDAILERIARATAPTYSYLYSPAVDSAAHDFGCGDRRVARVLHTIDGELARLAAEMPASTRLLLSADHGHMDVPADRRHLIERDEELAATFRTAPAYDARVMCFHLRDGVESRFLDAIARRFGERVFVLSTAEVEQLELLGPGPLSKATRARLGDFVAIVRGSDAIGYRPATGGREIEALESQHSGLTPEQMRIPLVVA